MSFYLISLSFPDCFSFPQPTNIPALCKNRRGKTRELGTLNQTQTASKTQSLWDPLMKMISQTKFQANLTPRTPSMVEIMQKALCFNWAAASLPSPGSPGPGRIRTRRTETLQRIRTAKDDSKMQKSQM